MRAGVDALARDGAPVLEISDDGFLPGVIAPVAVEGSLLVEIARDGARQMLAAALLAEVAAYVEKSAD